MGRMCVGLRLRLHRWKGEVGSGQPEITHSVPLSHPRRFPLSATWLNGSAFQLSLTTLLHNILLSANINYFVSCSHPPSHYGPCLPWLPGYSEIPDTGERQLEDRTSKASSSRLSSSLRALHCPLFHPVKLIYNVSPTFATTPLFSGRSLVRSYATHKSSGQPALIAAHVVGYAGRRLL